MLRHSIARQPRCRLRDALAGGATELKAEDRPYTIRITPEALRIIDQSSLGREERMLLFTRLKEVLRSADTLAKLHRLSGLPHCARHRVVLGGKDAARVFSFLLAILPERATVVVLGGASRRLRTS